MLPFLKDLAEDSQTVATVTAQEAAEVERLEKSLRRLAVEAETVGRAIVLGLVDPMRVALRMLTDTFANLMDTLPTFADVAGRVARLDIQGALTARDQYRGRVAGREAGLVGMMDEMANPTGPIVEAQKRVLQFSIQNEKATRNLNSENKRLIEQYKEMLDAWNPLALRWEEDIPKATEDTRRLVDMEVLAAEQILGIDEAWMRFQADIERASTAARETMETGKSVGEELSLVLTSAPATPSGISSISPSPPGNP